MVEIKLVRTNVLTRWRCTVCGGATEKDTVLCEGENEDGSVLVCPHCLKSENIDATLEKNATELEAYASSIRALKGNLLLPTYDQWRAETEAVEAEWLQCASDSNAECEGDADVEDGDADMEDGGYFKQRFIGGPLDGVEKLQCNLDGFNDGFWSCEHRVGDTVYTYRRQAEQFADSDYLLVKTEVKPDPAAACREREEALRQVVDYVADMGCDNLDPSDKCECITCLALEIREAGTVLYDKLEAQEAGTEYVPARPPTNRKLEGLVYTQGLWDCLRLIVNRGGEWGVDKETIRFAEDAVDELLKFEAKIYGLKNKN